MDNFSEQNKASTRCFCPQKCGNDLFKNEKKLELLVESIKRLEKEAVYCHMHKIPWLPVNSDKHFQLLFDRVKDT